MSRVIWVSDSPNLSSGFGLVTYEVCLGLQRLGYEIRILGWGKGLSIGCRDLDIVDCSTDPTECKAMIRQQLDAFQPSSIITFADVPWISYLADKDMSYFRRERGVQWIIYYPVDGATQQDMLPDSWVGVIRSADVAVTMSKYGASISRNSGLQTVTIPHGVNVDLFKPPESKDNAKAALGYLGKFVILTDARNHRRKQLPRTIDIVRSLSIPHEKFIFHLHTNIEISEDIAEYRYSVLDDIQQMGIKDVSMGLCLSPHLDMFQMAQIYSAADVHLLTSYGEGFGLPTLQAASAGVVPIAPSNSASKEVVGEHGFAIRCNACCYDEFGLVRHFVDRLDAKKVIESLYLDEDLLFLRSQQSREFAMKFQWNEIVTLWDELIQTSLRDRTLPPICPVEKATKSGRLALDQDESASLPKRASGHTVSVLPMPKLTVPVRLSPFGLEGETSSLPKVLSAYACASELSPLEKVFPGLKVIYYTDNCDREQDLEIMLRDFILVVDPGNQLPCQIQTACAHLGISFLGGDSSSHSTTGSLFVQARLLLTDFAQAESRLVLARNSSFADHKY